MKLGFSICLPLWCPLVLPTFFCHLHSDFSKSPPDSHTGPWVMSTIILFVLCCLPSHVLLCSPHRLPLLPHLRHTAHPAQQAQVFSFLLHVFVYLIKFSVTWQTLSSLRSKAIFIFHCCTLSTEHSVQYRAFSNYSLTQGMTDELISMLTVPSAIPGT
jgi:hypothetical protein